MLLLNAIRNLLKMKRKINWLSIRLKTEKFFKEQLWQYILVIAFVSFYAWLLNKPYQAIMFLIAHYFVRPRFEKQYHCGTTYLCMLTTLSICLLALYIILPMEISLLSTLPATFLICWVGCLAQDSVDLKKLQIDFDKTIEKLKEYQNLDIYKMQENELRQYCASKKLSEFQQDIVCMRVYQHLKISEICKYFKYGRSTIKYHIAEIKKKLDIPKI